jgi:hypothetical protein
MNWEAVDQPATFADLVAVLSLPPSRLERLLDRHRIRPAYKIGRVRCYDRQQVDAIAELVARS